MKVAQLMRQLSLLQDDLEVLIENPGEVFTLQELHPDELIHVTGRTPCVLLVAGECVGES